MNAAVLALKKQGVEVERFNLSQQIKEVMSDKTVAELIHKKRQQDIADYVSAVSTAAGRNKRALSSENCGGNL
jgi:Arsenical resistance operon protein ArsD